MRSGGGCGKCSAAACGWQGFNSSTIHAERKVPKGFPADVAKAARRKLVMVNNAVRLDDLKSPPGNRLEALQGDLKGKHSIRINDQWRIVFRWTKDGAELRSATTTRNDFK